MEANKTTVTEAEKAEIREQTEAARELAKRAANEADPRRKHELLKEAPAALAEIIERLEALEKPAAVIVQLPSRRRRKIDRFEAFALAA